MVSFVPLSAAGRSARVDEDLELHTSEASAGTPAPLGMSRRFLVLRGASSKFCTWCRVKAKPNPCQVSGALLHRLGPSPPDPARLLVGAETSDRVVRTSPSGGRHTEPGSMCSPQVRRPINNVCFGPKLGGPECSAVARVYLAALPDGLGPGRSALGMLLSLPRGAFILSGPGLATGRNRRHPRLAVGDQHASRGVQAANWSVFKSGPLSGGGRIATAHHRQY